MMSPIDGESLQVSTPTFVPWGVRASRGNTDNVATDNAASNVETTRRYLDIRFFFPSNALAPQSPAPLSLINAPASANKSLTATIAPIPKGTDSRRGRARFTRAVSHSFSHN